MITYFSKGGKVIKTYLDPCKKVITPLVKL